MSNGEQPILNGGPIGIRGRSFVIDLNQNTKAHLVNWSDYDSWLGGKRNHLIANFTVYKVVAKYKTEDGGPEKTWEEEAALDKIDMKFSKGASFKVAQHKLGIRVRSNKKNNLERINSTREWKYPDEEEVKPVDLKIKLKDNSKALDTKAVWFDAFLSVREI